MLFSNISPMWLFDDILKKPTPAPVDTLAGTTSGQGSGQPPQDDSSTTTPMAEPSTMPKFVIEKGTETTFFGQDTETKSIEDGNRAASEPTVHAEEADSSLLVATPESSDSLTASETTQDDVVIIPETPTPQSEILATPESEEIIATETNDLFAHLGESSQISSENENIEVPGTRESPLFLSEEKIVASAPAFTNPQEFIEKSLESIDTMIAKIDEKHETKIGEAEGYGKEKDRYTLLEKTAYEEASTMDDEKAHAIHMREILEKELDTSGAKDQKETSEDLVWDTLSTLAKENQSRGGGLSKVKEASKKQDETEALVWL